VKIPVIEVFPASMKPGSFALRFEEETLEKEPIIKTLEKNLCWLGSASSKLYTDYSRKKTQIKDLPVIMHANKSAPHQYRTRIFIEGLRNDYEGHFKRKVKFPLWHLIMCHKLLISLQQEKGMDLVPNAIDRFKEWFHEILFAVNKNHLPLFGDANSTEVLFYKSSFSPVKIYLIHE
jgi:hypothetical protein